MIAETQGGDVLLALRTLGAPKILPKLSPEKSSARKERRGAASIGPQLIAVVIALMSTGNARGEEPSRSGGGISYEEQLRFTPPAPLRPTASRKGAGFLICWSSPQPLKEHISAYDPAVARYRVYALDRNHDRVAIGETKRACFLDRKPAATTVMYAVTAIQRSGHESALSADAVVPP